MYISTSEATGADTFIERFGIVRWTKNVGRYYPRDGVCEMCGRTGAEVAAQDASSWAGLGVDLNPLRYGLLAKLQFDHCHRHLVVRGLLCLPCNVGLGAYEHGAPGFSAPGAASLRDRLAAYASNCPGCRAAA